MDKLQRVLLELDPQRLDSAKIERGGIRTEQRLQRWIHSQVSAEAAP